MGIRKGLEITNGWELIKDETVAKNTTSVTLSGLDGDSDIVYLLLVHYINQTDVGVCCDIRFNNDSERNYTGIIVYSDGSTVSTLSRTMSAIGFVGAAPLNIGWGCALIYARTGKARTVLIDVYEPNLRLDHKGWHWTNASDNITSIVLVAMIGNRPVHDGIGAGTRILLFKMKNSTP